MLVSRVMHREDLNLGSLLSRCNRKRELKKGFACALIVLCVLVDVL